VIDIADVVREAIFRHLSDLGITSVQRSILCDPYAVAMRTAARLPSAEFALLSRSGSTSRTLNSERLLWAEFFCHTNLHVQKGGQLDKFREAYLDGLRPPDNGHRPILQKGADECAIYLQAAVVADEAFLLERTHKFAYPCAGSTNHFREG
jgi:hypothetical protein